MAAKKKQEVLELSTNQHFKLIALSSVLTLNRLIWSVNSSCNLKLLKNSDLEPIINVPVFSDKASKKQSIISIFPNRIADGLLVKQLPNVDFIMEINGLLAGSELKELLQNVKKIEGILAVIEINPSTIKRKEPFCPE